MEILPWLGVGVIATVLLVTLRPLRPELATLLSLAAGCCLILLVLGKIRSVVGSLTEMANQSGLNPVFLQTVLKVVGVAYLSGFIAQVCRDAGEGTMAGKVELLGKVVILVLALPVMWAVLQTMLDLL